jgi:hypothetical protein
MMMILIIITMEHECQEDQQEREEIVRGKEDQSRLYAYTV